MTPPVRPEVDPLDALKALKQQASPDLNDPLAQLKALKPQGHDYHAEYASGALKQRMDAANARDQATLADEQQSEPVGPLAAFGHSLAATGANIAQGIPGMEAVEAGVRSLTSHLPSLETGGAIGPILKPSQPESYRDALGDIRAATGKIPQKLAIPERIAGSLPLSRFLPGSPVAGGGILGALDGALAADPDLSVGDRVGRAAIGAGVGSILGKTGEVATSGVRTALAKNVAKNLVERNAERAASAKQMYGAALAEGQGKEATDAIKDFLHETGIEEIVDELKQTRPFQTVAHDGPEMLDAVYKVLSDRAASLKRGLDAVTPNRPNIGRFRLQDTKAAQGELLNALSGTPEAPGPMPSYGAAVQDYAKRSGDMEAVQRGSAAMRMGLGNKIPSEKRLLKDSPEALAEWAQSATPSQQGALAEGVLGRAKAAAGAQPIKTLGGLRAVRKVGPILRNAGDPMQQSIDQFLKLLLLGGVAANPQ